jgi:hypothetical protein
MLRSLTIFVRHPLKRLKMDSNHCHVFVTTKIIMRSSLRWIRYRYRSHHINNFFQQTSKAFSSSSPYLCVLRVDDTGTEPTRQCLPVPVPYLGSPALRQWCCHCALLPRSLSPHPRRLCTPRRHYLSKLTLTKAACSAAYKPIPRSRPPRHRVERLPVPVPENAYLV